MRKIFLFLFFHDYYFHAILVTQIRIAILETIEFSKNRKHKNIVLKIRGDYSFNFMKNEIVDGRKSGTIVERLMMTQMPNSDILRLAWISSIWRRDVIATVRSRFYLNVSVDPHFKYRANDVSYNRYFCLMMYHTCAVKHMKQHRRKSNIYIDAKSAVIIIILISLFTTL